MHFSDFLFNNIYVLPVHVFRYAVCANVLLLVLCVNLFYIAQRLSFVALLRFLFLSFRSQRQIEIWNTARRLMRASIILQYQVPLMAVLWRQICPLLVD